MPTNTWEQLLDKAEAEGGGWETLPANDYNLVVVKAEAVKTKAGDKDMIKVQAKVVDEGEFKNRVVFHQFVISPDNGKALQILFRQLDTLGLNRENLWSKNPTPEDIASAVLNRPFRAKVGIKVYNGNENNEIKNFYKATEEGKAAAAAFLSGAPSDAPAPSSSAPSDAPPPAPTAAPPAPTAEAAPPAPTAPPAASTAPVPPPPPPPNF